MCDKPEKRHRKRPDAFAGEKTGHPIVRLMVRILTK